MPPLAPSSHRRLHLWRSFYQASEGEEVIEILLCDSRGAHRHWRELGSYYRQMDVKHARLICPGNTAANGERDGLGYLQVSLAGMTNGSVGPGAALPSSGIVNRYPIDLAECWTTGVTSNPHFSRYGICYSSAGAGMDATAADDTGGTFKRGDPAQGRDIVSIERFGVTDNRVSTSWLASRTEFGYNAESGAGGASFSAAPSSPSGAALLITPEVLSGPFTPTTGTRIQVRHRHVSGVAAIGTGILTLATAINFQGSQGMVFVCVAQGGWSTTDHLTDPAGGNANTDWKYADTETLEFLVKVMKVAGKKVIIRKQLGQNGSAGAFSEWNGTNSGAYMANCELVMTRWAGLCVTAGAGSVLCVLESPWQSGADSARINAFRADLASLADTQDATSDHRWVFFDLQAELLAGGYSTSGSGLDGAYTPGGDPVHQNFAGMNLIGSVRNAAVMSAVAPGGTGLNAYRSARVGPGLWRSGVAPA